MIKTRQTDYNDYILLADTSYGKMKEEDFIKMSDSSMLKELNEKYFQCFTVMEDDTVAGIATLCAHSSHIIEARVEIRPPYQQKGYGYSVMKKLLDFSKSLGYTVAVSYVEESSQASHGFLKKLGYEMDSCFNKNGKSTCLYIKVLTHII